MLDHAEVTERAQGELVEVERAVHGTDMRNEVRAAQPEERINQLGNQLIG